MPNTLRNAQATPSRPDPVRTVHGPVRPASSDTRLAPGRNAAGTAAPSTRTLGALISVGAVLEIVPDPDGLRLHSGDMGIDVVNQDGVFHASIDDGRTALRFRIVQDARGRLYLGLGDRALARDPEAQLVNAAARGWFGPRTADEADTRAGSDTSDRANQSR